MCGRRPTCHVEDAVRERHTSPHYRAVRTLSLRSLAAPRKAAGRRVHAPAVRAVSVDARWRSGMRQANKNSRTYRPPFAANICVY